MNLNDVIVPTRVLANANAETKKHALEVLSELLAKDQPELGQAEMLKSLVARERLGSTAIGGGVAVPHGRLPGLDHVIGALILLNEPVDYQAEDSVPVDLMFALLVPQACSEEHSRIVAAATLRFSEPDLRSRLRAAKTSKELYENFIRGDDAGDVPRAGLRA